LDSSQECAPHLISTVFRSVSQKINKSMWRLHKWPETVEPRACKIKETGNTTDIWLHQGQIKGQYPISYGTSNHGTECFHESYRNTRFQFKPIGLKEGKQKIIFPNNTFSRNPTVPNDDVVSPKGKAKLTF
jgi:hypothetical protein